MTFVKVNHISHYYFSPSHYTKALNDIHFTVKKGEFISLIGASGCGKSTLLSIIGNLMKPTEGQIYINDKPIDHIPHATSYMLQEDYLFPWKTIIDNVCLGPLINKANINKTKEEARALLERVGLLHVEKKYPKQLSGGMRQRAAFARTLMTNPQLLLLDEPFSALDFTTKLNLENLVFNLVKQDKQTVIFVTHDLAEAISMSDRILLMDSKSGTIFKTYDIPKKIRKEEPFRVRSLPEYQTLFETLWADFQETMKENEGFYEKTD
ncbi:MAG TPA: ABC transporter ATP-binding protein [Pseudogracilibacillus sp.]|nr:ABC transporter ATP-binding protein [Pseudogracilibacillus sp.]